MSVVKMLIKMFLFVKSFLTVSTLPLIYIYMRFMMFLVSVYIIFRVKPARSWDIIFFFLHNWCQILCSKNNVSRECTFINYAISMQVGHRVALIESLIWEPYLLNDLPSYSTSFSRAMYSMNITMLLIQNSEQWHHLLVIPIPVQEARRHKHID